MRGHRAQYHPRLMLRSLSQHHPDRAALMLSGSCPRRFLERKPHVSFPIEWCHACFNGKRLFLSLLMLAVIRHRTPVSSGTL